MSDTPGQGQGQSFPESFDSFHPDGTPNVLSPAGIRDEMNHIKKVVAEGGHTLEVRIATLEIRQAEVDDHFKTLKEWLDGKFHDIDVKFNEISVRLNDVATQFNEVSTQLTDMRGDIRELKADFRIMKDDYRKLKESMERYEAGMNELTAGFKELKESTDRNEAGINELKVAFAELKVRMDPKATKVQTNAEGAKQDESEIVGGKPDQMMQLLTAFKSDEKFKEAVIGFLRSNTG